MFVDCLQPRGIRRCRDQRSNSFFPSSIPLVTSSSWEVVAVWVDPTLQESTGCLVFLSCYRYWSCWKPNQGYYVVLPEIRLTHTSPSTDIYICMCISNRAQFLLAIGTVSSHVGNPSFSHCLPQHQHLAHSVLAKVSPVLLARSRAVPQTLCVRSSSGSWSAPLRRQPQLQVGWPQWPLCPPCLGLSQQPQRLRIQDLQPGLEKVGGGFNWHHVPSLGRT